MQQLLKKDEIIQASIELTAEIKLKISFPIIVKSSNIWQRPLEGWV